MYLRENQAVRDYRPLTIAPELRFGAVNRQDGGET
jgi:hypothetical protein